ncbi:MAG: hypothetical protein JSV65_13460 [Armatimonadota bacterium]|nr:MAG: hypothetical protein JSV65_13460 [Armatimonadota bacterium]
MDAQDGERVSRAEVIFVAGLLAIAVLAWVALILYQQGIWFAPATASIVYRVLWTILWLPGIALSGILLVRRRRVTFGIGLVFQVTAVGIYWWSTAHLTLSGTLALAGLSLPLLARPPGETLRAKCAVVCVIAVALALACFDSDWTVFPVLAVPLCILYACAIWPQAAQAFEEVLHREEETKKRSRAYRWLHRILIALAILCGLTILFVGVLAGVALLAVRGLGR